MTSFSICRMTTFLLPALLAIGCGDKKDAPATAVPQAATADPALATKPAAPRTLDEQVTGLWVYTGLRTRDGVDLPLTGLFLFKDGVFLQQAVFDDGLFEDAGSMAHAGPYMAEPATGSVHLIAEQTISIDPNNDSPISFTPNTEHDVTVSREADSLTLIFGMGTSTVQEFTYVGPGAGDLYNLEHGALAFVDGHFILVAGNEDSVTSGYGTYEQEGEAVTLNIIRWSEASSGSAKNLKDTILRATFDGRALVLADGREFRVRPDSAT